MCRSPRECTECTEELSAKNGVALGCHARFEVHLDRREGSSRLDEPRGDRAVVHGHDPERCADIATRDESDHQDEHDRKSCGDEEHPVVPDRALSVDRRYGEDLRQVGMTFSARTGDVCKAGPAPGLTIPPLA